MLDEEEFLHCVQTAFKPQKIFSKKSHAKINRKDENI
jgi:hypothetical protein